MTGPGAVSDQPGTVLWTPPDDARQSTEIGRYLTWLERELGLAFPGYDELWAWSVEDLEGFWASIWDYFQIRAHTPHERVLSERTMPGARWFEGATLNYAEHLFGRADEDDDANAVIAHSQTRDLELREFLADAGKRSRILAGLAQSMAVDVLVLDSGSGWDAEASGFVTNWGVGYPPAVAPALPGVELRFDPACGGAPVVLDLLGRVRAVVPDAVSLGVTLVGPLALVAAAGDVLAPSAANQIVLAAARAVAEAGAGVVIVREDGSAEVDGAAYAAATTPLWRSLQFFRSVGVLQVSGAADGWAEVLAGAGRFLPVFNAVESPGVAAAVAGAGRPYGLALAVDGGGSPVGPLAIDRCALLTHDRDLAGQVPIRDAAGVVSAMTI